MGKKKQKMQIVALKTIKNYAIQHAESKVALMRWYEITEASEWKDFNDIKKTFRSADYVGNKRYVFNIKGNDYRLVAIVLFEPRRVLIRFIGTHAEYNKINCSTI